MQCNFEQIKATHCLKLENGTPVVWPKVGKPGCLNITSIIRDARVDHAFSVSHNVIGVIDGNDYYVAPLSVLLIKALDNSGFALTEFHVPFSHGDTPLGDVAEVWKRLLATS